MPQPNLLLPLKKKKKKIIRENHCFQNILRGFKQRCDRPQTKMRKNSVKLGKNAKNRLKIKEKAEILAQENFQK